MSNIRDLMGLTTVGFGIGWLASMSATPVVSIVITSLTATAAAVLAVMSGLEGLRSPGHADVANLAEHVPKHVRIAPVAVLVLGLVFGALVGLNARSYGWFGTDLDAEIYKWTKHGRSEKEVTDALFAAAYPTPNSDAVASRPWLNDHMGLLFGSTADLGANCADLLDLEGAELRKYALGSSLKGVQQIAGAVEDPKALKAVLEVICQAD